LDSTASPINTVTPAAAAATAAASSKTATYLSSFLEAVLSSLRLSMELHDVRIRIQQCGAPQKPNQELYHRPHFIEIHTQSIFYRDPLVTSAIHNTSKNMRSAALESQQPSTHYQTVMKTLDITRISILTGSERDSNNDSNVAIVGLLDGTSRICFRIVEYNNAGADTDSTKISPCDILNSENNATSTSQKMPYTQQDIQVSLHQKLNISVDIVSLQLIRAVVHSFTVHESQTDETTTMVPQSASMVFADRWVQQHHKNETHQSVDTIGTADVHPDDDEADCHIIETIMAQYREARLLVEKKEIRGGMLFPSLEENGQVTFDTFFDANESISSQQHRHSSMLKESILGSMIYSSYNNKQQPASDWIYRKFTLHLQEGGIKLTLPSSDNIRLQQYPAKEYVLLTFNDINVSVQMSSHSSSYTLTMNHIEIEDASFVQNGTLDELDDDDDDNLIENLPVTEIGTMLRFVQDGDCMDDDEDDIDLLVQAPCLSMSVNIITDDKNDTMDWDIVMEPIELSYRHNMMTKLIAFFQVDASHNPPLLEKPRHSTISVHATCASLTFYLPLPVNGDDIPLHVYDRAGYVSETTMVRESSLGFVCEQMTGELRNCNSKDATNEASVSCHNIFVFVSTPVSRYSAFDHRTLRLDFISICGRTEIDPCIPITIRCNQFPKFGSSDADNDCGRILAESLFPKVPPLSSYKAREEEEDDDEKTTSKATELGVKLNDPQSAMLLDLTNTDTVVTIHVPEIVVDFSASELFEIQRMISATKLKSTPEVNKTAKSQDDEVPLRLAYSFTSESLSLLLHVEDCSSCNSIFALSLEDIKAHCSIDQATAKHLRLLVHDFDFLESKFSSDLLCFLTQSVFRLTMLSQSSCNTLSGQYTGYSTLSKRTSTNTSKK
jgi:hypothetical protein